MVCIALATYYGYRLLFMVSIRCGIVHGLFIVVRHGDTGIIVTTIITAIIIELLRGVRLQHIICITTTVNPHHIQIIENRLRLPLSQKRVAQVNQGIIRAGAAADLVVADGGVKNGERLCPLKQNAKAGGVTMVVVTAMTV